MKVRIDDDTRLPSIHDADAPNAMVNDDGDRFFPDSPEDAAYFAEQHGARFIHTSEEGGDP